MSLESFVLHRLADPLVTRLRRRPEDATVTDVAIGPAHEVDRVGVLPTGSMRILEGLVAVAAIATAVLIGAR